jgi:signal transduction histidine kinase
MSFERLSVRARTLRFHLLVLNTAVVLVIVLPTLFMVREYFRTTLFGDFDLNLREDAKETEVAIKQFYPNEKKSLFVDLDLRTQGHLTRRQWFVQVYDANGKLLHPSPNAPSLPAPSPDEDRRFRENESLRYYHRKMSVSGLEHTEKLEEKEKWLFIRVGASLKDLNDNLELLSRMVVVTGGLILVLAPLGGYWLAHRATRPMAQIIRSTAELRPSKIDERLPLRGTGDEVDQLSHTINGLLDRIAAYLRSRNDFLANAAHELRSPLAAIRASAEVALTKPRGAEDYASLLSDIMEECGGLETLVNQLLLLAEGDTGKLAEYHHLVAFDDVVRKSLAMFEGVAEAQNISLQHDVREGITVMGNEGYLRQVVNNLIDNALKFNHAGGTVSVSLEARGKEAYMQVTDSGTGIAAEDLPRVFERFYQGDKSRQRQAKQRGNGLGLSICHAIVTALGGRIEVESALGRGSTFRVWLPLAAAVAPRSPALVGVSG